jgi:hypothetical protein
MNDIIVINNGNNQEYRWSDDLGLHQYYANVDTIVDKNTITNITITDHGVSYREYQWNDNLGFHQYYADFTSISMSI